jgi:hypothetical protein
MRSDLYIEHEVKVSSEVRMPLGYAERIYVSATLKFHIRYSR